MQCLRLLELTMPLTTSSRQDSKSAAQHMSSPAEWLAEPPGRLHPALHYPLLRRCCLPCHNTERSGWRITVRPSTDKLYHQEHCIAMSMVVEVFEGTLCQQTRLGLSGVRQGWAPVLQDLSHSTRAQWQV